MADSVGVATHQISSSSLFSEHIPENSPCIFGDTCSFGFKKFPGTESHQFRISHFIWKKLSMMMQRWRKARIPEGLATANRISGTPWYEGGRLAEIGTWFVDLLQQECTDLHAWYGCTRVTRASVARVSGGDLPQVLLVTFFQTLI